MKDKSQWRVAVVGLGYVGLPLAMHIVEKGFSVLGVDRDERKLRLLQAGRSYIPDVPSGVVAQALAAGAFAAERPSGKIGDADYVIVSVPTPLNAHGKPDLAAVRSASAFVAVHLQRGQTVVFESSTYPGTLEEVVLPILSRSGLEAGKDFFVGYSPERIDPGNDRYPIESIPKVVSGLTSACLKRVDALYSRLFRETVPVSGPKVAEACKLFENIQRLVNISLVNELDLICERMGIDVWETLQAASTKPFGFTPYWPGPGIGGHCIPVDPQYFQWKARQFGAASRLIAEAHRINAAMPQRVAERVERCVAAAEGAGAGAAGSVATDASTLATGAADAGAGSAASVDADGEVAALKQPAPKGKVLVIGLAYKKDVNDIRESAAIDVFSLPAARGYELEYFDPHVPDVKVGGRKYVSKTLTPRLLQGADAVVILTDHSAVDWELVRTHARRIVDTRGALRRTKGGRAG